MLSSTVKETQIPTILKSNLAPQESPSTICKQESGMNLWYFPLEQEEEETRKEATFYICKQVRT